MKKEIFEFEGRTYDILFEKRSIYLYVVIDKLSGVRVSEVIPAANDFVAIIGFNDFVAKKKEKNDINVYELKYIGCLDDEDIKIIDQEAHVVADSRDNLEKFINECKAFILANEED